MSRARISRRDAMKTLAAATAVGLVDRSVLARAFPDPTRLSWLANRNAKREGAWRLDRIEGEFPRELNGTLYRVAPGQSENHGVSLRHLFDGDAFMSGFSFRDGEVSLRANFVSTPGRQEEQKAGKMIYTEFGTAAPGPPRGSKNQPSVNVIAWDGRLLGLSEGGHPSALDPADLTFQGFWDFHGTLPRDVSFTAHPRFDPATGMGYGWGIRKGAVRELVVYRMELDGRLTEIAAIPQAAAYMVHDATLTDEHVVFAVPPLAFDYSKMGPGRGSPADVLSHLEDQPIRVHLVPKDGAGETISTNGPSGVVYHHGNAFSTDDAIVFDSLLYRNNDVNRLLHAVSDRALPEVPLGTLTRIVVDPLDGELLGTRELEENHEFPRFDDRAAGQDQRTLFTAQTDPSADPLAFVRIVRHDLYGGASTIAVAGAGQAFGEPVFVPHPTSGEDGRGWVLHLGYDGAADETFLDVRDAVTLELASRVWSGNRFPLGFHGNFTPDHFVRIG